MTSVINFCSLLVGVTHLTFKQQPQQESDVFVKTEAVKG